MTPPADVRSRASLILAILAGAALAMAATAWLVGGGIHLGPWTLWVRELWRPLAVAAVALAVGGMLPVPKPGQSRRFVVVFVAAAGTAVLLWAHYQVRYCGGADSFGYLSAARAVVTGTLVQPQPIVEALPFPHAIDLVTPFGWTPKPGADALVPFYPLGFPLMMAMAMAVAGTNAAFYVPLLTGVGLLWLTYRLTRAHASAFVAGSTTVIVAFSPMVTNMVIQPMSDVPAAFWYLAALAGLAISPSRPALAGAAFGMAVWTRPLLLVTAPAFLCMTDVEWRRIARFCAGAAPVMAAIAAAQWWLYGSPLRTGYGGAAGLFTTANLAANAYAYAKWIVIIHSPAFVVALALGARHAPRTLVAAALTGLGLGIAPYLFKLAYFDDWDLVRYALPVLVPCLIVSVLGVAAFLEHRLPARAWRPALMVIAGLAAIGAYQFVSARATFHLVYQESRYELVANWVRDHLDATSVVLAEGHSGSLRFYADRQTLRTDLVPGGALAEAVRGLQRHGHATFAVVDGDEEARSFTRQLDQSRGSVRAEPVGQVRGVIIYRLSASGGT